MTLWSQFSLLDPYGGDALVVDPGDLDNFQFEVAHVRALI
jgi:hypothetical protein